MSETPKPLLIVESVEPARGGGVRVFPRFSLDRPGRGPFVVRLVLPDGAAHETEAVLEVAHVRGPLPPFAMMRLPQIEPAALPVGTRVYRLDESR